MSHYSQGCPAKIKKIVIVTVPLINKSFRVIIRLNFPYLIQNISNDPQTKLTLINFSGTDLFANHYCSIL